MKNDILLKQMSLWLEGFCVRKQSLAQPAIKCSKLTIETLEQGVKYIQR